MHSITERFPPERKVDQTTIMCVQKGAVVAESGTRMRTKSAYKSQLCFVCTFGIQNADLSVPKLGPRCHEVNP